MMLVKIKNKFAFIVSTNTNNDDNQAFTQVEVRIVRIGKTMSNLYVMLCLLREEQWC